MLQLTFNPGLTLTGFRTTPPRSWAKTYTVDKAKNLLLKFDQFSVEVKASTYLLNYENLTTFSLILALLITFLTIANMYECMYVCMGVCICIIVQL